MKRITRLAVAIIAICLITTTTHAQSGNLKLRFRVPFPFTVENTTFAAGEYEVTQPERFLLALRNVEDQASAFEPVQPARSRKEADGRGRAIFHRYGTVYFLAAISDGSWQSTYDLRRSKKEERLTDKDPTPQLQVVGVLANGTVERANVGH
jgi:hypothetical protein